MTFLFPSSSPPRNSCAPERLFSADVQYYCPDDYTPIKVGVAAVGPAVSRLIEVRVTHYLVVQILSFLLLLFCYFLNMTLFPLNASHIKADLCG